MDAIALGMNPVARELTRPADVRQSQSAQQEAQAAPAAGPTPPESTISASTQPSAIVTLSASARGEAVAQATPGTDKGTVEARAIEQARAAAANGDVRNSYSAQRALASYEAMARSAPTRARGQASRSSPLRWGSVSPACCAPERSQGLQAI